MTYNRKTSTLLKCTWESITEAVPVGFWRLSRSSLGCEERAFLAEETARAKTWPCENASHIWGLLGWDSTGACNGVPGGEWGQVKQAGAVEGGCLASPTLHPVLGCVYPRLPCQPVGWERSGLRADTASLASGTRLCTELHQYKWGRRTEMLSACALLSHSSRKG